MGRFAPLSQSPLHSARTGATRAAAAVGLMLLLFPASACSIQDRLLRGINGNDRGWPEEGAGPYYLLWNGRAPQEVQRADPACSLEQAPDQLGMVDVWLKRAGKVELSSVDLRGVSGKGLVSSEITGVLYGFHSVSQFHGCELVGRNRYKCEEFHTQTKQQGSLIPICRSNGGYPRDSAENAALAVVAGLKQSVDFMKKVPGFGRLAKTEVLLLPIIEDQIVTRDGPIQSSYALDNAFWTVRITGKGQMTYTIAALPHSKQLVRAQSIYFWEQQGVLSHEYGHHIFNHYMPRYFSNGRGLKDLDSALEGHVTTESRHVQLRDIVDSVNEGFADLVAHYAHNSGLNLHGKIDIGGGLKHRDINEKSCDDGNGKALSRSVLKHFFSHMQTRPDHPLTPDHQDVHTIGATIAHGLDSLFILKFGETSAMKDSRGKAELLLEWAKGMNQGYGSIATLPLDEALRRMVLEGVRLAAHPKTGALSSDQCAVLKRVFPEYIEPWVNEQPQLKCSY